MFVLLAFGLLLQGCTLQKRSLMPGWHVEKVEHASSISEVPSAEPVLEIFAKASEQPLVAAPSLADPLIPLKGLMACSPSIVIAPEWKIPRLREKMHAFRDPIPAVNNHNEVRRTGLYSAAPGDAFAGFLLFLAIVGGSLGLLIFLIGLAFGSFSTILLGSLLFGIAIRLRLSAANPEAKWRLRAVDRRRKKQQNRSDRPEEMAKRTAELEARRAAQREELQLKQEQKMKEQQERRLQQEAEQQARKAKRQAFFQKPFVKTALGFGGIIGLYLLLF